MDYHLLSSYLPPLEVRTQESLAALGALLWVSGTMTPMPLPTVRTCAGYLCQQFTNPCGHYLRCEGEIPRAWAHVLLGDVPPANGWDESRTVYITHGPTVVECHKEFTTSHLAAYAAAMMPMNAESKTSMRFSVLHVACMGRTSSHARC